jgi:hypothetical protein
VCVCVCVGVRVWGGVCGLMWGGGGGVNGAIYCVSSNTSKLYIVYIVNAQVSVYQSPVSTCFPYGIQNTYFIENIPL